jgi:hypothetical protein
MKMEIIDRAAVLDYLEVKWPAFVRDALALPEAQRAAWLHRQGYARAADLLAHVAAWWRLGMQVIAHHRTDADYQHPPMDVDAFNLAAVTRVTGQSEADVLADFHMAREALVAFVNGLSDAELANPKINRQLVIEIIEHLHEHEG